MDCLTITAELVNALAWPVAIVLIVLILRKPLGALLPEVTRLRWKDFEVEFAKKIVEIEKQAEAALPTTQEFPVSIAEPTDQITADRFTLLAELSPPAAILESWIDIELALREAASRHEIPANTRQSPIMLIDALSRQDKLDPQTRGILENLRALRNEVVHARSTDLTTLRAKEFRDLALRVVAKLKGI